MPTRVLFVDDDLNLLSGLQRVLHPMRRDWKMHFASGAADALEALAREPYDVIVTDLRMPGMNGTLLLEQVRERYPEVTRIVLSGQADRLMSARAAALAHAYLNKPCEVDVLRGTIETTRSQTQ